MNTINICNTIGCELVRTVFENIEPYRIVFVLDVMEYTIVRRVGVPKPVSRYRRVRIDSFSYPVASSAFSTENWYAGILIFDWLDYRLYGIYTKKKITYGGTACECSFYSILWLRVQPSVRASI